MEGEHQDSREHQQPAEQRVDEELHGGVDAPLVAPVPDQEVHRDEHPFPEHVEQEEVAGQEDAGDRRLENEKQRHEELRVLLDLPRREHADRDQERREDHQEQTDPVHPKLVRRAEGGDPSMLLDHLHTGLTGVEARQHAERECEGDDRGEEGPPADQSGLAVREDGHAISAPPSRRRRRAGGRPRRGSRAHTSERVPSAPGGRRLRPWS